MQSSNDEIQNIINELKEESVSNSSGLKKFETPKESTSLDDNNVNEYVYKQTAAVIEAGLEAINRTKDYVIGGMDAKELGALAAVINATTKAIDSMNNINLQNKKAKNDIELKKMDIVGKKEVVAALPAANNILIATRDEMVASIKTQSQKSRLDYVDKDLLDD